MFESVRVACDQVPQTIYSLYKRACPQRLPGLVDVFILIYFDIYVSATTGVLGAGWSLNR
jgi:hypothetical protein